MTSRRNFLGLIAAAPLAAPAIAKAAAESQRGGAINIHRTMSPIEVERGWSPIRFETLARPEDFRLGTFKDWSCVSHTLDFDTGEIWREWSRPSDTPNRLHGVAINADGDAI